MTSDLFGTDTIAFGRAFAMPNAETFSIKPIEEFVLRYLTRSTVSIDPFARNRALATWRNDIDPGTAAPSHMDAEDFCKSLGITVDLALFDPPYSPRQISECYKGFGREVTTKDTQNAALYKRVRDALDPLIAPGGIVLSFGWSSNGMGKGRARYPRASWPAHRSKWSATPRPTAIFRKRPTMTATRHRRPPRS